MLDSQNSKEPVYAEHLAEAKEHIRGCLLQILPTILQEHDRAMEFAYLLKNLSRVSIVVTRNPLIGESVPSLKFGLDEDEQKGEKRFTLQFTTGEAREIQTGMDPSLYAALCEEGILRALQSYEKITNENDEFTHEYSKDIEALYALLEFVQTASNPFDIAEEITMFPFRY